MDFKHTTKPIYLVWLIIALAGCAAGTASQNTIRLGRDGSFHPDATAGYAGYTGRGNDGEGWVGNSDGEGGPSAIPPAPGNL